MMKEFLQKFFSAEADEQQNKGEAGADEVLVATCALLLEMAHVDGNFSDEERRRILDIFVEQYGLSADEAEEIERMAEAERRDSIQLWQFTNRINSRYSRAEKLKIIEQIWRVVYADGRLDKHEDYLVHKIANLLNLPHRELIEAKMAVLHGGEEA